MVTTVGSSPALSVGVGVAVWRGYMASLVSLIESIVIQNSELCRSSSLLTPCRPSSSCQSMYLPIWIGILPRFRNFGIDLASTICSVNDGFIYNSVWKWVRFAPATVSGDLP